MNILLKRFTIASFIIIVIWFILTVSYGEMDIWTNLRSARWCKASVTGDRTQILVEYIS